MAKQCVLSGDREIAARHELAPGGRGDAFHGGDHRLRQSHDPLHHRGAAAEKVCEIGPAPIRISPVGAHFLKVVASRESLSRSGDDHGADAAVAGDGVELGGESVDQRFREGVAGVRPVQGQRRDACRIVAQQRGRADPGLDVHGHLVCINRLIHCPARADVVQVHRCFGAREFFRCRTPPS